MGTRRPANAGETDHGNAGLSDDATQTFRAHVDGELNGAAGLEADAGAGAAGRAAPGGLESLGVAADPASLAAEVAAAVPGVDQAPGQLEAIANASWADLTPPGVEVISAVVFPAWEITPDERGQIAPALAECLEQIFPGGINGKYACWLRLILACGAITVSRAVQNGGRIPPLFITREKAALRAAAAGRRADPAPAVAPAAPVDPAEQLTSLGVP